MSIGITFQEYLKYNSIEQKDAAEKLEISAPQLSMMVNGKRPFHQETIEKLVKLWPDININWLFQEELSEENKVKEPGMGYIKTHEAEGIITDIEENLKKLRALVAQK